MEATKWLKPLVSVSRIGDSASVQAVTRVNAEQALYGAGAVKEFRQDIFFHWSVSSLDLAAVSSSDPRFARRHAGTPQGGRGINLSSSLLLAAQYLDGSCTRARLARFE
jgi:hypothetical protein